MKRVTMGAVLLNAVALCMMAQAADQVLVKAGSAKAKSTQGKLTKMTALEVSVEDNAGDTVTIPTSVIERINFDGEPAALKAIRSTVRDQNFAQALKNLEAIEASELTNPYAKQDADFLKVYCAGKMAMQAGGEALTKAGGDLTAYLSANSGFYRYFEGVELVGDMASAIGNYAAAAAQYEKLASSPSEELQLRGGVAKARALKLAGKKADAAAAYENVLTLVKKVDPKVAEPYRLAAVLGEAEGKADAKQTDAAVKQVMEVIKAAKAEDTSIQARAYLALGNCYLQSGDFKRAIMAYLHVHLLYFGDRQSHVEALFNLERCYNELKDTENAMRIRATITTAYPNAKAPPSGS